MSQKRDRPEGTPGSIEAFWPFKRAKATEQTATSDYEPAGSLQWSAILPSKGLGNSEASVKPLPVNSRCSSSFAVWQAANPIRYNARLVASAQQENEDNFTAHVAPVDLAEHSQHFADAFNTSQSFQRDSDGLQCLPVNIDTTQACLHTIVGALYSRSIHLKPATVEMTLRAAVFLEMPCIIEACVAFIKKYVIKQAPLEVVRLGKELKLSSLVTTAEECIIGGSWSGHNLKLLIKLLRGRSVQEIRTMLHSAPRATISELEVVEVLKAMPEQPSDLAEAIDFDALATEELQALGRHITSLPPGDHASLFWSDVARRILHGLLHPHTTSAAQNSTVLWEVDADLLTSSGSALKGQTEVYSPFLNIGGHKIRMLLKLGDDAGLYAKPQEGRRLAEGGKMPAITLFCLPQVVWRSFSSTSAFLADLPDKLQESKGWGIGISVLKTSILSSLPDLTFSGTAGKTSVMLGMHVQGA